MQGHLVKQFQTPMTVLLLLRDMTKSQILLFRKFNPLLKTLLLKTPLPYNPISVASVEHNFKQIVGSVISAEQKL